MSINRKLSKLANIIDDATQNQYLVADGSGELVFGDLTVSLIDGTNTTITKSTDPVTTLRFDTDSGFDLDDLGGGAVKIKMNSTFKTWEVPGQQDLVASGLDTIKIIPGSGLAITTNPLASPQEITFSSTLTDTDGLLEGSTNLYYTDARVDTHLASGNVLDIVVRDIGARDVNISGNLNVAGTTTTVNQTTLTVNDSKIFLADGNNADIIDSGVILNYNDGTNKTAGMFRDATDGAFNFYHEYTPNVGTTLDTAHSSYTLAKIKADEFIGSLDWNNIYNKDDVTFTSVEVVDLTVTGTQTINNTTNVSTINPFILLNDNPSTNVDTGVIGKYDINGTDYISGYFKDVSDGGKFKFFEGSTQSFTDSSTVDVNATGFTLATVVADTFEGSLDWSNVTNAPSIPSFLNDLSDVDTTSNAPADGQTIIWDAANSIFIPGDSFNQTDFDAAIALKSIDVLADVDTTSNVASSGDALIWDGTNWVPGNATANVTISATAPSNPELGDVWLDEATLDMYIYYPDTNGNIWVQVNNLDTPTELNDLTDVDLVSNAPTNGDALVWDAANSVFVPQAPFSQSDFDTAFAAKDTDDLSEGTTNLYYTDTRVNNFLGGGTAGNIITTGYIAGPASFTIDPAAVGDNTGTVVIAGNLTVQGTTTTVNSNVVEIGDSIITLNSDETGAPSQNGGIEIERGTSANVQLRYNEGSDKWEFTNDGTTYTELGTAGTFTGTTDDVTEGSTNLYFTNARADARIAAASIDALSDVDTTTTTPTNGDALVWDGANFVPQAPFSQADFDTAFALKSIDALADVDTTSAAPSTGETLIWDGSNFVPGNAIANLTISTTAPSNPDLGDMWLDEATLDMFVYYPDTNGNIWVQVNNLDTPTELNDLTDVDLVSNAPSAGQALVWDAANNVFIPGDSFSQTDFDAAFAAKDTDDLSEGTTNLYYTDTRFDNRLATKTTTDLTEGTNLYYTDARVTTRINNTSIDALQDVDTTSVVPSNGEALVWNGSEWAPGTVTSFSETLTTLSIGSNILSYVDENGATTNIDLSLYLDDTNLARLTSGSLNSSTGIATFTRDDSSVFTVDFSSLINLNVDAVVTVSGGVFYIDGNAQETISLEPGRTYKFNQDDSSNSTHPLRFSTTENGTHGGGVEYTTGVTVIGTPGSSVSYTEITVTQSTPTLYYYCANHSGMGGKVAIGNAFDTDELVEGSTNLYYTDARADARIAAASVGDLNDVDITTTTPSDNSVLVWDSALSKFVSGFSSSVNLSSTVPSNPSEGDLWLNNNTMNLYVWYTDSDSSQWVHINPYSEAVRANIGSTPPANPDNGDLWVDEANLDFYIYNGTAWAQLNQSNIPTEISDLIDVNASGVIDGQVLVYDLATSTFIPGDAFSQADFDAAFGAKSIDALSDVDTTSATPNSGQALVWDGANWAPGTVSAGNFTETTTTLTGDSVNQKLVFTDETGTANDVDLSWAVDDTNLARITSGTLDNATGIATFTRDDATTFTVDFSALFDDTNTYLSTLAFDTGTGVLTGTLSDSTAITVDLDGRYLETLGSIDGHTDVDITTTAPTDGQALVWDNANSKFVPGDSFSQTDFDNAFALKSVDALSDVDTTSAAPTSGDALVWDGANWVPGNATANVTISATAPSNPELGDVWLDEATLDMYIYYPDTNGNIWVQVNNLDTPTELNDLTDVDLVTNAPADGEALVWDAASSTFVPGVTFSQADFDTAFTAKSTDDLSEGSTNLYHTDARALAATDGQIVKFANMFATLADLPNASTYHGMFAHVHAEGKGYFAHNGNWIELLDVNSSIDALSDVDTTSAAPNVGEVLRWDGSNFVPGSVNALETLTTLTADSVNQRLQYTDEAGTVNNIDLSWTVDDTNLARITSGSLNGSTGIATFTRDDATTFTVDFSPFFDDTNLARITSGTVNAGTLTLTRDDASTISIDISSIVYNTSTVTVAGGVFVIDGQSQITISLEPGQTYRFDQSDVSNSTHPLHFSTTSNGTHNGGVQWTTGVTVVGTPGTAGAYTQISVNQGTPTLHYYCANHSGMGGKTAVGNIIELNELDDVNLTSNAPTDGQALIWDAATSKFVPGDSFSQADFDTAFGNKSIDALSDVDTTTTTPASGDTLVWNGANFVPGNAAANVTVSTTAPTNPEEGDLWYDEDYGDLFVYVTDGSGTSQWVAVVDSQLPAALTISSTPPANPNEGDLWVDEDDMQLYTYYVDVDSSQWVQITPEYAVAISTISATQPTNGYEGELWYDTANSLMYVYDGTTWQQVGSAINNIGDLGDVDTSTVAPTNGQVLIWNSTTSLFEPGTIQGYSGTDFDTDFAAKTTDDLTEGTTNLYYTDTRVNSFLGGGTAGNIITTGYLAGPATFTIDPAGHGDNTGTVVIAGNLQVDGTTTTINSTTVEVDDLNLTLGSGATNAAAANGGGITVDLGTDGSATFTYNSTTDTWDANKTISANITGQVTDISNFTTDDLAEGSTNLYYTDARVQAVSINAVVEDTTPTLGGNLDAGTFNITNISADGYSLPTADGTNRQVIMTDGSGILSFEDLDTIHTEATNQTGSTILKGTPVYQTGTSGNAMTIAPADASSAVTMPAVGVLEQDLAAGATGFVIHMGQISGVDTSSFSEGDTIYVAVGGGYTNVAPTGEGNLLQNLGRITKVHATNGGGVIMGAGRTNAVPNLNDGNIFIGNASNQAVTAALTIDLLGDVDTTTTAPVSGDTLVWNGTNFVPGNSVANLTISTTAPSNPDLGDMWLDEATLDMFVYYPDTNGNIWVQVNNLDTPTELNDLTDVDLATNAPADGEALVWDAASSTFVPGVTFSQTDFDTAFGNKSIDALSDVDTTSNVASNGDALVWDGANWVPQAPFSQTDFDTAFAAKDTDDLSEGTTNLYYTDARVDSYVSGGTLSNIVTTGYLRGPASFTIDPAGHGDNTGTVVIAGNLQVDGVTTAINSTTLNVDDKNLELGNGSTSAANSNGGGITLELGTDGLATILYNSATDTWDFNKNITATVTGTVSDISNHSIDGLSDVDTTTSAPVSGDTLVWNGSNFVPGNSVANLTISTTAPSNPDLGDMWLDEATLDMFVYYPDTNGNIWVQVNNLDTPTELNDLTDVDLVSNAPADGQALIWNAASSTFVPGDSFSQADFDTAFALKSIDALSDVDTTSVAPASGDTLVWDGANFVPADPGGRVTLSASTPTPAITGDLWIDSANLDTYAYDGANWAQINQSNLVTEISDLIDVNAAGIADGQVLVYDNATSTFIPGTAFSQTDFDTAFALKSIGGLSDVDITTTAPTDGQVLIWDNAASEFIPGTIQGYASSDFDTDFAAKTTDDLTEGTTNLYYTDARVNTFLGNGTAGNIITTGYLRGPANFTIDPAAHGDNTGTVIIAGNLQVDGVTTQINSTTLNVEDLNLTLGNGATNAAAANNGGITLDLGTDGFATIQYASATDTWNFNKDITANISGTVSDISNHSIDGLSDVDTTSVAPTTGDALVWDGSNFVPGNATANVTISATAPSNPELGDVWLDEATLDMYIYYPDTNGNIWVQVNNLDTPTELNDLTDVDLVTNTPTDGQALIWDNANSVFVPGDSFSQADFDTAFTAKSTDDLSEGSTNLYYTDARADARIAAASINALSDVDTASVAPTDGQALVWDNANSVWEPGTITRYTDADVTAHLLSFDGSIIPDTDVAYDLGSTSAAWRDVYIGPGSLYMNNTQVLSEDAVTSGVKLQGQSNQHVHLVTHGTGETTLETSADMVLTAHSNADITLNTSNGHIVLNGNVVMQGKFVTQYPVVTVAGGVFVVDGASQPMLSLEPGRTYRFDQSDSTNTTHPFRFSTTPNGTHNSGVNYTTGVTEVGTPGTAGAYTEIEVDYATPTLYYYCGNHSGMGSSAAVGNIPNDITTTAPTDGQALVWDATQGIFVPGDSFSQTDFDTAFGLKSIGDLSDVDTTGAADNSVLVWDATLGIYAPGFSSSVNLSSTVPSNPSEGDLWLNNNTMNLYVWYTDSDSSQWVHINPYSEAVRANIGATPPANPDNGDLWVDETNLDFYIYTGTAWAQLNQSNIPSELSDLIDVTTGTPTDGQALVWDAATSQWIAGESFSQTDFDNAIALVSIDDLSDVDTTTNAPVDGQSLIWDNANSKFIPGDSFSQSDFDTAYAAKIAADTTFGANVIVTGNLQVDGTTTTINSTTLTVDDLNITLGSGAADAASANNGGITLDLGTDGFATIAYNAVDDTWDFNKTIGGTISDISNHSIGGLSDVDITTTAPSSNHQILKWNGTEFVIGDITVIGPVAPISPDTGQLWFDTADQYNLTMKIWDGSVWQIAGGGSGAVEVAATPPAGPQDGDLWIEDTTMNLYVYYEDADSSQWIQLNNNPSLASQGIRANVEISATAPFGNLEAGDLWYNSDDGSMYVYYEDVDTSQWVQVVNPFGNPGIFELDGIVDGTNQQVLTTDGAGNVSFQDVPRDVSELTDSTSLLDINLHLRTTGADLIKATNAGSHVLELDRTTDTGEIIQLKSLGVQQGSINIDANNNIVIEADNQDVILTGAEVQTNSAIRFNAAAGNTFIHVEGTTDDTFETSFVATEPTADRTVTFKDESGTVALVSDIPTTLTDLGIVDGTINQVLKTDGAGNFTFQNAQERPTAYASDTAPTVGDEKPGDLWYNTDDGSLYVLFEDVDSEQWVQVVNPFAQLNLFDLEDITDGTNLQVLTTDGAGNATFQDVPRDIGDLTDTTSLLDINLHLRTTGADLIKSAVNSSHLLELNRTGITGDVIKIDFNGIQQGTIGTNSTNDVVITSDSGNIELLSNNTTVLTINNTETVIDAPLKFSSTAGNTFLSVEGSVDDAKSISFTVTEPTFNRTVTFKDEDGTVALVSDIPTTLTDLGIADGTINQVLKTDGNGNFSFQNAAAKPIATAGDTAPNIGDEVAGDLWYNTTDGSLYVYYQDADTLQWAQVVNPFAQLNLFDLEDITDGTNLQVLTTDGAGNATFQDVPRDVSDLTDSTSLLDINLHLSTTGADLIKATAAGSHVLELNRTTDKGEIIQLKSLGLQQGSINIDANNNIVIEADTQAIQLLGSEIQTNNALRIGTGTFLHVEGATDDAFETSFAVVDPTADNTITFKDGSGTVAFVADIPTSITDLGISDGTINQVLKTDGNGNFSFQNAATKPTSYAGDNAPNVGDEVAGDLWYNTTDGSLYVLYQDVDTLQWTQVVNPFAQLDLFDLEDITDGTANQVLTTDGAGNATFQDVPRDVSELTDSTSLLDINLHLSTTGADLIKATAASSHVLELNRTTDTGEIIQLKSAGVQEANISIDSGNNLVLQSTSNAIKLVGTQVETDSTIRFNTPVVGTTTFNVTVATGTNQYGTGNKYYIEGYTDESPTLTLLEGQTYRFDQSDASNATHQLLFSTTPNGTWGGGVEYTAGVTKVGTAGTAGAYTEITPTIGSTTLYYYCINHSGMGGQVDTVHGNLILNVEGPVTDAYETSFIVTNPSQDRTVTFKDEDGTVALISDIPTTLTDIGITDGTLNQILSTDGAGNFSFVNNSGISLQSSDSAPSIAGLNPGDLWYSTTDGSLYVLYEDADSTQWVQIINPTPDAWLEIDVNTTISDTGGRFFVDTSTSAKTITLPANPLPGTEVHLIDATGNAGQFNITVSRNGNLIEGTANDILMDYNRATVHLVYYNAANGWLLAEN